MTLSKIKNQVSYQILFESLPDLYLILDPKLNIVAASDAYLSATMVKRDNIIGKPLFDIFPDNPLDPKSTGVRNLLKSLQRVLATKKADAMAVQKYDIRRPPEQGGGFEVRYWSPVNTPCLDALGGIIYIIHRVEDVTELIYLQESKTAQLKLTEQLRTEAGQMQLEIYQRAQQIQKKNEQLEFANSELARREKQQMYLNKELERLANIKTKFFANVSHELRTPLMLILGPVERLLKEKDLSTSTLHDLDLVCRNAHVLLKHVNDLLDVTKLESGKMPLTYSRVNLTKLLQQTIALFDARIKERNLTFTVTIPKDIIAEVDSDKIQRIIMNLVSNAIKFTPEKGKIDIIATEQNDHVNIIVKDTGPGIPITLQQEVFERFFQVEESSTRRFGGFGLGLAITKEFVELHGGTIHMVNAAEGGAVFTLILPLKAPKTVKIDEKPQPSSIQKIEIIPQVIEELKKTPQRRIESNSSIQKTDLPLVLVVEDNVDLNQFICSILTDTYQTASAYNGEEGLQQALHLKPDAIISDVMMPKMSGVQFVHALRKHSELLSVPVIILTAKADNTLCVSMLQEGAQDYMVKPFSELELKARLANLIHNKQVEDELERFIYLTSHDLTSPIPAMKHLITWIEEDSLEQLSQESKKHLNLLKQRAIRMSNLLTSIIKYFQTGHECMKEIKVVDVQVLLQTIIDTLAVPASFHIHLPDHLPKFKTYSKCLYEVFYNLIENCIKHHVTPYGNITITCDETDKYFRFSVEDDGPGIDQKYHDRVFEIFQTLQSRDVLESSGMGLSIVKKIIHSIGSSIHIESDVTKGTRFIFTWPKFIEEGDKKYEY